MFKASTIFGKWQVGRVRPVQLQESSNPSLRTRSHIIVIFVMTVDEDISSSTVMTNKQMQQSKNKDIQQSNPSLCTRSDHHQCGHNSNAALMYQYVPLSHLDAEYRIELDQYKEESDSDVRDQNFLDDDDATIFEKVDTGQIHATVCVLLP